MTPIQDRPVLILLRLEGLAAFAAATTAYIMLGYDWRIFLLTLLLPDLAMLGYLFGPWIGGWSYNIAHSYTAPAVVALLGLTMAPILLPVAAVWAAHIGMDRTVGYGLKSRASFHVTHLDFAARAVR